MLSWDHAEFVRVNFSKLVKLLLLPHWKGKTMDYFQIIHIFASWLGKLDKYSNLLPQYKGHAFRLIYVVSILRTFLESVGILSFLKTESQIFSHLRKLADVVTDYNITSDKNCSGMEMKIINPGLIAPSIRKRMLPPLSTAFLETWHNIQGGGITFILSTNMTALCLEQLGECRPRARSRK